MTNAKVLMAFEPVLNIVHTLNKGLVSTEEITQNVLKLNAFAVSSWL
jgi:hypothetical protein